MSPEEGDPRQAGRLTPRRAAGCALAVLLALAAVYTAGFGVYDEVLVRAGSVGLAALAAILLAPLAPSDHRHAATGRRLRQLVDAVLFTAAAAAIHRYIALTSELELGIYEFTAADRLYALGGMAVLLELTRRLFGAPLAVFCLMAVAYALFGDRLPWIFEHAGFSWKATIRTVWYGFDGVFGRPVAVVTSFILVFIVFGAVLEGTGAGRTLLKIAVALTGRLRGGPAHAAVVASALFGTMSGSAVANVVGTGVFTIPMIKARGFPAKFAGAVEAAASTGGQFTPPVMGAVAFIMADVTGIPYLTIAAAALMPAMFYYGALFATISVEAAKRGIPAVPAADRTRLTPRDWMQSLSFVVPLAVIVVLLVQGRSPGYSGFWATAAAIVMGGLLNPEFRRAPQRLIPVLARAGESCAKLMVVVAAVGIVIGVFFMTGLGQRFAAVLLSIAGDALFPALVVMMIGSIVLGMGMPTVAAYLIIVLAMGPAIGQLGVPVLLVHLFVLYFGVLSTITPPVALAAYAAAPICGASPMATAIEAVRVAAIGFVIPFVLIYNPTLVLVVDFDIAAFAWVAMRLTLAIWLLATGLSGHGAGPLPPWVRVLRSVSALCLLGAPVVAQGSGVVLAISALAEGWARGRSAARETGDL